MTPVLLLITLFCQFMLGFGMLSRLGYGQGRLQVLCLSLITGFGISTWILFVVVCLNMPLTAPVWMAFLLLATILATYPWKKVWIELDRLFDRPFAMGVHELVVLLSLAFLLLIALWRSYYFPVTTRDALVGMDLVAMYAVKEGHFISSVFTTPHLQGELSNQPFYAPFTALMQIIYLLTGMLFGKVWVGIMTLAFFGFLYARFRRACHPILAGILLVVMICVPGMYPYFYFLMTDWPNAVFFGLAVILQYDYFREGRQNLLHTSAIMMGLACWTRSETILFAITGALLMVVVMPSSPARRIRVAVQFLWPSVVAFLLWNIVFLYGYMPVVPGEIAGIGRGEAGIWEIVSDIYGKLLFNPVHYGYSMHFFLILLIVNSFSRDRSRGWELLSWIVLLYTGFVLIAWVFPAASVENTIKRSFFKFFPVMFFYLAQSSIMQNVSAKLWKWERR